MHYLMPMQGKLSLHSGCNVGADDDVTMFFGLSGTGKTTLSAGEAAARWGRGVPRQWEEGILFGRARQA